MVGLTTGPLGTRNGLEINKMNVYKSIRCSAKLLYMHFDSKIYNITIFICLDNDGR